MAREGKSGLVHDAQDGDAELGADQTQSSWMPRIETKVLAENPGLVPPLPTTNSRGDREERAQKAKRKWREKKNRTDQERKE